jgi:hypothetical protein
MSKTKIKHNRELSLSPLEVTRLLSKATQQNKLGQYYNTDSAGQKVFGYHAWQTGDWVCYTCGLLCNCEREGE